MDTLKETVTDLNSQNVLHIAHSLREESEVTSDTTRRNKNLATIVTNIRRNRERNMFDSLMRKPVLQRTKHKIKKSATGKRHVRTIKNPKRKFCSDFSIIASDEENVEAQASDAIPCVSQRSNENDLIALFNLSSDSDSEARSDTQVRLNLQTSCSSRIDHPKKLARTLKNNANEHKAKPLQKKITKRKAKSPKLTEDNHSISGETARTSVKKHQESDSQTATCSKTKIGGSPSFLNAKDVENTSILNDTEEKSSFSAAENVDTATSDAAIELPLFSEFLAERKAEVDVRQKETVFLKIRKKLQHFAHSSRICVDIKPQKMIIDELNNSSINGEERSANSSECFLDVLSSKEDENCFNEEKPKSESSQKSVFRSQSAVQTGRIFSMYNDINDGDLSVLDDV